MHTSQLVYLKEKKRIGALVAISSMLKPTDGNLERKLQEESGHYQYQYDSLNRLTQVKKGGESLSRYEYDAFNNRTRKSTENENIRYYYNAANQLIRSEGALPVESYPYDSRGNMTSVLKGEETVNRYIYDAANRLAYASNSKGQAVDYQYNGLGNRVGMREYIADGTEFGSAGKNSIQREPLPDGNPAKEVDYLLDLTKQYHNLLEKTETAEGMASSQDYIWDTNAVFMTEGGNAHIYLQDELGSTVRLVGMEKTQQTVLVQYNLHNSKKAWLLNEDFSSMSYNIKKQKSKQKMDRRRIFLISMLSLMIL